MAEENNKVKDKYDNLGDANKGYNEVYTSE